MIKKNSRFFLSFLFLFSIFFSLVLLELAVRIGSDQASYYHGQYPKNLIDSKSPSNLKPNFNGNFPTSEIKGNIRINSKGLRDYERTYLKKVDFRILGLGDSFTFGHGVEFNESFLTKLELLLKLKFGESKIEIIKSGSPGFSIKHYFNFLRKEGYKYDPDMTVLFFFIGNDTHINAKLSKNPTKSELNSSGNFFWSVKSFLRENSHLYSYVVAILKTNIKIASSLYKLGLATGLYEFRQIEILRKNHSEQYEIEWQKTFEYLNKIKSLSKNLLLILLPSREQVNSDRLRNALTQLDYDKKQIDIYSPNRKLIDFLNKEEIKYLDLLNGFISSYQKNNESLFFVIDPHYNVAGHKFVAKRVYSYLEAKLVRKFSKKTILNSKRQNR